MLEQECGGEGSPRLRKYVGRLGTEPERHIQTPFRSCSGGYD